MTIDEAARGFTDLRDEDAFWRAAGAVLSFQRDRNPVYGRYCKALARRFGSEQFLGPDPDSAPASNDARERTRGRDVDPAVREPGRLPPFLPIEAFKQTAVAAFPPEEAERVFESSGTGGTPSRHFVRDLDIYDRSALVHFQSVFGDGPFLFASHLPGYRERGSTSSLLYMVELLMDRLGHPSSASILGEERELDAFVDEAADSAAPMVVFGAAFGLLEIVERRSFRLPDGGVVIETGGMKTHRREIERRELHDRLAEGFGVPREAVFSEYGMCELLSQCYTRGEAAFYPPPWMRAWIVDPDSPFVELEEGESGALAVLDLANLYSASAVLTQDRAVRRGAGFEVLGRLTGAELRGCNFLLEHV